MASDSTWTVITGAGAGIGAALARGLSDRGWHVLAVDKDSAALQQTVSYNSALIKGLVIDISEKCSAAKIAAALPDSAKVTTLVHNAALTPVTIFGETSYDEMQHMLAVNAVAPFMITQELAPRFIAGTRILHLGTNLAHRAEKGLAGYCISKAAFYQLHKQSRLELQDSGVLVSSARTGAVNTNSFHKGHRASKARGLPIAKLEDMVMEKGMIFEPDESARFLMYLLCDVSDDEYGRDEEWDAYDQSRWPYWRS